MVRPLQPASSAPQRERLIEAVGQRTTTLTDALVAIFEPFPVPKATSLLASAQLILGDVLRDAELVLSARRVTAPGEAHARRSLLVAQACSVRRSRSQMRILAFITAAEPVDAILRHLGLPATPPPSPPHAVPPSTPIPFDCQARFPAIANEVFQEVQKILAETRS